MCPSKPRLVLIEQHNLGREPFFTTPLFWDCKCEEEYIHACLEEVCPVCKATQAQSADARVDEVLGCSRPLNHKLIAVLEMLCECVCPELVPIPF
jgi:hypothetical protein